MIGAASKGIIDREYRHNAQIYKQLYQPNPFASETDQDIQKYLSDVEQKKVLTYQSDSGTFDRIGIRFRSESVMIYVSFF